MLCDLWSLFRIRLLIVTWWLQTVCTSVNENVVPHPPVSPSVSQNKSLVQPLSKSARYHAPTVRRFPAKVLSLNLLRSAFWSEEHDSVVVILTQYFARDTFYCTYDLELYQPEPTVIIEEVHHKKHDFSVFGRDVLIYCPGTNFFYEKEIYLYNSREPVFSSVNLSLEIELVHPRERRDDLVLCLHDQYDPGFIGLSKYPWCSFPDFV